MAAIATPAPAASRTRSTVANRPSTESAATARAMALRTSTRSRSVQGLYGQPNSQSWRRNSKAISSRYPARRSAAQTRSAPARPWRSRLSSRKASVIPSRNRNMAGGSPPKNCDAT